MPDRVSQWISARVLDSYVRTCAYTDINTDRYYSCWFQDNHTERKEKRSYCSFICFGIIANMNLFPFLCGLIRTTNWTLHALFSTSVTSLSSQEFLAGKNIHKEQQEVELFQDQFLASIRTKLRKTYKHKRYTSYSSTLRTKNLSMLTLAPPKKIYAPRRRRRRRCAQK